MTLWADDEGSITVEAALSLTALLVVFIAMISALTSLGAYISAVDIAGAAYRVTIPAVIQVAYLRKLSENRKAIELANDIKF